MSDGHVHRCMSCGKQWRCPTPAVCGAQERVLPIVVLDGPEGPQLFDHVCQRSRQSVQEQSPSPRVLFRPLLTSGMYATGDRGAVYLLVDSEQPESEQVIALWHETLHLLGLKDEHRVEALAQKLAAACREILAVVKEAHAQPPRH